MTEHLKNTRRQTSRLLLSLLGNTLLWGGVLAVAFYGSIPFWASPDGLVVRYFCGHPLEYATTILFCLALAELARKLMLAISSQRDLSHARPLLEALPSLNSRRSSETCLLLRQEVNGWRKSSRNSWLARQVIAAVEMIEARKTAKGLEEHLKHLSELAWDRLHRSYHFVNTINWSIPIIGFLGTVIGITVAIANVTPEQLSGSLTDVTSGLAIAFDTTALSLTLSLVMVFLLFAVKRRESALLVRAESILNQQLPRLFAVDEEETQTLWEAQAGAALDLKTQMHGMVERQTDLWNIALEGMRTDWELTISQQRQKLVEALDQGTETTLAHHATALQDIQATIVGALGDSLQRLGDRLEQIEQQRAQRSDHELNAWRTAMSNCLDRLQDSTTQLAQRSESFEETIQLLRQWLSSNDEIARVQQLMTENLETIRSGETFEQTLQTLTGAVHLLTARTSKAA